MGTPKTIPDTIRQGQWQWPQDASSDARMRCVQDLTKKDSPKVVEALGQCLDTRYEHEGRIWESCAEKLLDMAPRKALLLIWHKIKRGPAHEEDPVRYYDAKGLLLGALAVYYVHGNHSKMLGAVEKWVPGPNIPFHATDITRQAMLRYIVRHPHRGLEDYVVEGLHARPPVDFVTAGFLMQWPCSPRLARHVLELFEKSPYKRFLTNALHRWKTNPQTARPHNGCAALLSTIK